MQLLLQPNVSARFISGIIWDKSSLLNNLPLFLSRLRHVFLYLLNQRMAIYHREGQLRIFYLARSVPAPNSAFLWKTAVILIDEIQRCPKQSGGSPTVAHRRGSSSVVIVKHRERSASGEHQGKKSRFHFKRAKKQRFFTGSGKVQGNLFHLQTKTILAWLFAFSYIG